MRFKTNLKITHNLIDLTPLVDVIFLMLIFFLITSDILPLKSLNIQNPSLDKDAPPLTTQLIVVQDAQNVIYVGSKKHIVDLNSLENFLKQEIEKIKQKAQKEPTVVLSVDRAVTYGDFLRTFSICSECSSHVRLVFKPSSENLAEYF